MQEEEKRETSMPISISFKAAQMKFSTKFLTYKINKEAILKDPLQVHFQSQCLGFRNRERTPPQDA